jgi:phage regulator Rha-like protein
MDSLLTAFVRHWHAGALAAHLPIEPGAAPRILEIRGQRVVMDSDLAALYGVNTKRLNEQVRRNQERFPADFLLLLSDQELASLRSQIATLKPGRGRHRKYPMLAFSEHGALMAATLLNTPRAITMSVYVIRAFVKLRQELASTEALAKRLAILERSVAALDSDTRKQFDQVYEAILGLMSPPPRKS